MKDVIIIPKTLALKSLGAFQNDDVVIYYLDEDLLFYRQLNENLSEKCQLRNLSGMFHRVLLDIKPLYVEIIGDLNSENNSFGWWGGQIASKSSSATPMLRNMAYVICAKHILTTTESDIILITGSQAVANCIAIEAQKMAIHCRMIKNKKMETLQLIKCWVSNFSHIILFLSQAFRNRHAAFKYFRRFSPKSMSGKKQIVIRSWVTDNTVDECGHFKDRNFGDLAAWLWKRNCNILILPMFFSRVKSQHEMYQVLRKTNWGSNQILIPELYLKLTDYFKVIFDALKLIMQPIRKCMIKQVDVSPIIKEVLSNTGIAHYPFQLSLCYPLLRRIKDLNFKIDQFCYPFENNAPEKHFILGCRRYFPAAAVVGFQHTAFYDNQTAFFLSKGEFGFHPLPDKIVCSGKIYPSLLHGSGFPANLLVPGANLRFDSVYKLTPQDYNVNLNNTKLVLLPLTFSYELALDLILKVHDAVKNNSAYQICIRNHPLLSREIVREYLSRIGLESCVFADDGTIQDWYRKTFAVISTGGSITLVEAAVSGVPFIRVIPDNSIFYDPFAASEYPLEPVNTAAEITDQLRQIEDYQQNGKGVFEKIAAVTLDDYFTKPNDNNMEVFLS